MFQGTGSDVGKSLLVAGLGRAFTRRGLRVLPFKPQNMSNNAAVTADGGEIGRAQALQARACRAEPRVDMNPVLLKPHSDTGAQIIVQGRVWRDAEARRYQALKPGLLPFVLDSFARLSADADLVLIEGAGSPAEVNLRAGDIANMGFAEAADVPVVLIGDIDRGGVIASIVGTHTLLEPAERARLKGYLINKFRGDVGLFGSAVDILQVRTGLDCLGIVPYWAEAARLPAEDAVALDRQLGQRGTGTYRIVVPRLPNISNFDDLDPLSAEPGVSVEFVAPGRPLPRDADLVLLAGSKATRADLAALRAQGWDVDILAHVRTGGRVLGLCGGYQMLGRTVADPLGIEGEPGESAGLALLEIATVLGADKTLARVDARDERSGARIQGYEIHMGASEGTDRARPFLVLDGRNEGAVSADGRVAGCYLHGLFAADRFRAKFLGDLGAAVDTGLAFEAMVDRTLDRLADHLETVVDLDRLLAIARSR